MQLRLPAWVVTIVSLTTVHTALGETIDNALIHVSRQEARWAGPGGVDLLSDAASNWFVISGDVRNTSGNPVAYVKLVFELVDDNGTTVASEYGYNHRAEDLRLPEYEAGNIRRVDLHIPPLQPGESDMFRMLFIRSQVPVFTHWRVRVLQAERD